MITFVGIGHAPVDVIVETHRVGRAFSFTAQAELSARESRLPAAIIVRDQIVSVVGRVVTGAHP